MPSPSPPVGIKDAFRGFAAAALTCTVIALLRSPFDAYFSGVGIVRLFSDGILGLAAMTVAAFIVVSVVGLPLWLLLRHFGVSKGWHFAVIGAIVGALLASRVNI